MNLQKNTEHKVILYLFVQPVISAKEGIRLYQFSTNNHQPTRFLLVSLSLPRPFERAIFISCESLSMLTEKYNDKSDTGEI